MAFMHFQRAIFVLYKGLHVKDNFERAVAGSRFNRVTRIHRRAGTYASRRFDSLAWPRTYFRRCAGDAFRNADRRRSLRRLHAAQSTSPIPLTIVGRRESSVNISWLDGGAIKSDGNSSSLPLPVLPVTLPLPVGTLHAQRQHLCRLINCPPCSRQLQSVLHHIAMRALDLT